MVRVLQVAATLLTDTYVYCLPRLLAQTPPPQEPHRKSSHLISVGSSLMIETLHNLTLFISFPVASSSFYRLSPYRRAFYTRQARLVLSCIDTPVLTCGQTQSAKET